jgi:hypothetical protein
MKSKHSKQHQKLIAAEHSTQILFSYSVEGAASFFAVRISFSAERTLKGNNRRQMGLVPVYSSNKMCHHLWRKI